MKKETVAYLVRDGVDERTITITAPTRELHVAGTHPERSVARGLPRSPPASVLIDRYAPENAKYRDTRWVKHVYLRHGRRGEGFVYVYTRTEQGGEAASVE